MRHAGGARRAGRRLVHRRLPGARAGRRAGAGAPRSLSGASSRRALRRRRRARRTSGPRPPARYNQGYDDAIGPPSPASRMTELRDILARIPNEPGVYRFLDGEGEVLYVGKAKELRKRVSSYFRAQRHAARAHRRDARARRATSSGSSPHSESEALLLEDNFIKESRPPFNLRLRDDKSYPYIEITLRDEWPRVRFFRGRHVPGNLYFGPYSSARKVRETLGAHRPHLPVSQVQGRRARPRRAARPACSTSSSARWRRATTAVSHEEYMEVVRRGGRLPARPPERRGARHRARDGRGGRRRRSSRRRPCCATGWPPCATCTSARRRASRAPGRST